MGTATVTVMSTAEARARYETLVRAVNDLATFKELGEAYALESHEAAMYDEIRDLEFLLELD